MSYVILWWRTLNKYTVIGVLLLATIGLMLITTSGPSMSSRIGEKESYFINKQVIYLCVATFITIFLSTLSLKNLKKFCLSGLLFFLLIMILVHIFGYEIKGGKRWIKLGSITIQPSEFIKPLFAFFVGWLTSININKLIISVIVLLLYSVISFLLIKQPDIGMFILISISFLCQLFISGLSFILVGFLLIISLIIFIICYLYLPHIAYRVNNFFLNNFNYQVEKALLAFQNGGFYGVGPGEGRIKQFIPDSHSDFIFAVAGEEFGGILCIIIVIIFFFVVMYNFYIIIMQKDNFITFVGSGILLQFSLQSIVNIGVNLHMFPTKGMTLPLISYGGSSLFSVGISIGILLVLTKRKLQSYVYKLDYKKCYDLCL